MRIVYAVAAAWLLAGVAFAGGYLLHDYTALRDYYLALGPLYREAQWTTDFFTPATKAAADRWAVLGLVMGLMALGALAIAWRKHSPRHYGALFARQDLPWLVALLVLQVALWYYGHSLLPVAFDEAFSAVHAAGAGPFVALAYYMLPNNHLLFNFLNALCFGWAGDLVLTGRILSLLAYLATGVLLYGWLRRLLGGRLVAFSLSLLLLVLLPSWGFAVQARGYALLYFFSWGAFICTWRYIQGGRGRRMETLLGISCALGYATVPVFLYVHLGLLAWIGANWVRELRVDWWLVGSQAVAGVAVLLFYLPAISFSGLGAITGNRYVAGQGGGVIDFVKQFLPTLPDYVNYLALDLGQWIWYLLPVLLVTALILGLRSADGARRSLTQGVGWVLLATLATVLLMRAVPFHRTLGFQLQLVGLLLALLVVPGRGPATGGGRWWYRCSGGWLLAAAALIYLTPAKFSLHLYYYGIVPTHRSVVGLLDEVPDGAVVGTSDEAFYARYLLEQQERHDATEPTYYVKREFEPLPTGEWERVGVDAEFILLKRVLVDKE